MPAELGPAGDWHGFELRWQIWPAEVFPSAMPFTVHVTVVSVVFDIAGVRVTR